MGNQYFTDHVRVLTSQWRTKLTNIGPEQWDMCDVKTLASHPGKLFLQCEGIQSVLPLTNLGMKTDVQETISAMSREDIDGIEEDIIREALGKAGNPNFGGLTQAEPKPIEETPKLVKPVPVRPTEVKSDVTANCTFSPKIGDFSATLPQGLISELGRAKALHASKIEAKIKMLQTTLNKVKTNDVYIGSFRLWLRAWAVWITRCTGEALTAIFSLVQQAIAVIIKGRTHALVGIRRTFEKVLRSVHDVRLLPPMVQLEGDPSRTDRLKAAFVENLSGVGIRAIEVGKDLSKQATAAKEVMSSKASGLGARIISRVSHFFDTGKSIFSTLYVRSQDGKSLLEIPDTVKTKLSWGQYLAKLAMKPVLLLSNWWSN